MNEESETQDPRSPGLAAGATRAIPAFPEFLIEAEKANCQQGFAAYRRSRGSGGTPTFGTETRMQELAR
jgi:hypothetical protein